jgi:RND family efflux transporter MFP subunit
MFEWRLGRSSAKESSRRCRTRELRPEILFVLAAGLGVGLALACQRKAQPAPPPPEVEVVKVEPKDLPIQDEWIGTLDGSVNAQIRAQVTGYLQKQDYREGSHVKAGDLLFEIDPRPFQAVLDQARAKLAQDRALLGKSRLDVQRYTPLAKERAISKEELDNAVQAERAGAAQVKADEATVETARLNLGFTKISSPIDGLAGIALAQVGDLVSPSSGLLTTVSAIDPIRVYFQISESLYLTVSRDNPLIGQGGSPLELFLANGSLYPLKGKVAFLDRQVNSATGTLQVVGLFPNPDSVLRPGQYARVRAETRVERQALAIPQRAVTQVQGSYQIAVVAPDDTVHTQSVKVGPQVGSSWIIADGLKPGDRVVVEGVQKIHDGARVKPKLVVNSIASNPPPVPDSGTRPETHAPSQ